MKSILETFGADMTGPVLQGPAIGGQRRQRQPGVAGAGRGGTARGVHQPRYAGSEQFRSPHRPQHGRRVLRGDAAGSERRALGRDAGIDGRRHPAHPGQLCQHLEHYLVLPRHVQQRDRRLVCQQRRSGHRGQWPGYPERTGPRSSARRNPMRLYRFFVPYRKSTWAYLGKVALLQG